MEVYSAKSPVDSRLTFVGNLALAVVVMLLCLALIQRKQAVWDALPETWLDIGGDMEVQIPSDWKALEEGAVGRPSGPELRFVHSPIYSDNALNDLIGMTHVSSPRPAVRSRQEIRFAQYAAELVELSNDDSPVTTVALIAADPSLGVIYLVIHAPSVVSQQALDILARIGATARNQTGA